MAPSNMMRSGVCNEESWATSDDEVEEIQGHPHYRRQHIYVWRQRGYHWAGHEEIAEVEEVEQVERVAKRLVSKVKVKPARLIMIPLNAFRY